MLNVHLNGFLEHGPKINKPELHLGKLQNPSSCYLFLLCFTNKKMGIEALLSHMLLLFGESQQRVRGAGTANMAFVH